MIRTVPPCSATNRRPDPSPALTMASGLSRPPTNGSSRTVTRAGSKAPALAPAEDDGRADPAGAGVEAVEPVALGPAGADEDGFDAPGVLLPLGPVEPHATANAARTTIGS